MDRDRPAEKSWRRAGVVAVLLLAIGLVPAAPFLTTRAVGTSEADNYNLALADAVTQLRAGVVPPLVGQTPYAFNGRIHPLRNAPYMFYLAGALDLVAAHRLSFWELQNFSLALSLAAAAFTCYFGLRWGTGCGRGFALVLAAAYAWCPGLLVAADAHDLFMTVYAAPFLPLALAACLRQARQPAARNDFLMAGALAAAWLAHPPVALWTTAVVGLLRLVILVRQPSWRAAGSLAAAGLLFFALAGFGFLSGYSVTQGLALLSVHGAFKQDFARVVVDNLRTAFPAALLPISRQIQDLGNMQLGYGHWLLLAFAVAGLGRSGVRGTPWDVRRVSVLALVAGTTFLLVLCLPIPGLTRALWLHLPQAVHLLTNIWPMQRLYLVATALIVFAAALTRTDFVPRRTARILVAVGLAWSLWQAEPFVAHAYSLRWSAADTAVSHEDSNVDLSATSYAFFGLPDDYTSGVIDPLTQLRLISVRDGQVTANLSEPALARAPVVQRGVLRRISPESDQLAPGLTLAPGKRYLLQLDFLTGPTRVYLKFSGEGLRRSYRLPDAGGESGFGMAPENSHAIGLWTALDHPETITAEIPSWGEGGEPAVKPVDFANFTLQEIDPASLPVRLESFLPLRCVVEAPEEGLYLETFRQFLSGYTARVDDRDVAVLRSPAGKVMVPVPRGRSEVRVSYAGSSLVLDSFWLGAAAWLGFALWLVAGAWPGGRRRLRSVGRHMAAGLWRGIIPIMGAVLVLLVARAVWHRGKPLPAQSGPLRVRYLLSRDQLGKNQPIVVLGHDGNGMIVFLNPIDAEHVRVGADVWGELLETKPIPIEFDRIQELIVSASALYPADDPRVRALDAATAQRLRGELRIDLNGANVLSVKHPPNSGETRDVHLGENRIGGSFAGPRFTGEILSSDRLAMAQSLVLAPGQVVQLRLTLPPGFASGRQPLLTLAGGKTAVIYAVPESPHLVRLGYFSFDGTWDEKGDLPLDANDSLALEIRAGRKDSGPEPSALSIDGLGRHLLGPPQLRPLLDSLQVTTGRNLAESAAVYADFGGSALSAEIGRGAAMASEYGPFDLVVSFPNNRPGRLEPLVVSGRPGAADLVYVEYVDPHHVRFGLDHWGQGGATSELVPLDYAAHHELEISLGSLYPAATDRWWAEMPLAARQARASRATVRLDGQLVLDVPVAAYPSSPERITVGANRIGASSCDPDFHGQILLAERLAPLGTAP